MAAVSAMIFEHKKMKTITGYTFSICHEVIVLDDTTLMAEIEELKILLKKVKEESEKALKLSIQKTKMMASGPITSWQIDGETVETVSDFIFGALKSLQMVTPTMKLKDAYFLEEKQWQS